jgi:GNAT superfamily N-acetyltransferase
MKGQITIRPFAEKDAAQVRQLFITINKLLASAKFKEAFDRYIELSLHEEIDQVFDYYNDRNGSFWVAELGSKVVGMFGLEQVAPNMMELRRMYVDPDQRRSGIGSRLLKFAEEQCRSFHNKHRLCLSTSETQPDALSLYQKSGYELLREEIADTANNKTIGGGIRRYYFVKNV